MLNIDNYSHTERLLFWSILALDLTVAARDTYVQQTEQVAKPGKLRAFNEMLHGVCYRIIALQGQHDDPYDTALLQILAEMANRTGLTGSLAWALEDSSKKARLSINS